MPFSMSRAITHMLAGLALLASGSLAAATGKTDWRARFEAEAPAAWENYRHANRYAQGVMRARGQVLSDQPRRGELELKLNESGRLLRIIEDDDTGQVFGQNSKYWFHLKSGKGGSWMLVQLLQGDQLHGALAREFEARIEQHGATEASLAVRIGPDKLSLSDLMKSKRTRVSQVAPKQQNQIDLLEVTLEIEPDPAEPRTLIGGTLLLDPVRGWLPISLTAIVRTRVGIGTYSN